MCGAAVRRGRGGGWLGVGDRRGAEGEGKAGEEGGEGKGEEKGEGGAMGVGGVRRQSCCAGFERTEALKRQM